MGDAVEVWIVGVAYPSLFVSDLGAAKAHWERLLGPAGHAEEGLCGFRLGDTWLTLFDARHGPPPAGGPRGTAIALRVAAPAEVDALHARLVRLGATTVTAPRDTWMYERMRHACVDDPFGLRLDVYASLRDGEAPSA